MALKIHPEHYEVIKARFKELHGQIEPSSFAYWRKEYENEGLSEKRFVWDLYYTSGLTGFTCDVLYKYMNDNHLYSALRRIVKEIEAAETAETAETAENE